MGKTGRKNKRYSPKFKLSVIIDMRENHLGYRETVRKYGMSESGSSVQTLKRWEYIFLEEGAEGLMKERRGGFRISDNIQKDDEVNYDEKTKKELILENRRLRMEIDYIKKLSALVLAEERKNEKRR